MNLIHKISLDKTVNIEQTGRVIRLGVTTKYANAIEHPYLLVQVNGKCDNEIRQTSGQNAGFALRNP